MKKNRIDNKISRIMPELLDIRREIHMYPELGMECDETLKRIKDILSQRDIDFMDCGGGICVDFGIGEDTLLMRADIDGLPITEETDLPFKSRINGRMHACGHDIHTTIMLGVCILLKENEETLNKSIRVIFQPGEETGEGALNMVEQGLLNDKNFTHAFAMHVDAKQPLGHLDYGLGKTFASSDNFDIDIKGASAHGARAYEGIDCISIGHKLYDALYFVLMREINPVDDVLFSIASIQTDEQSYNVLPASLNMKGTLRTYSQENREYILNRFQHIIKKFEETYNVEITFKTSSSLPELTTDVAFTNSILEILKQKLPEITIAENSVIKLGSEDFSNITKEIPVNSYLFIGAGPLTDKGSQYGQHNPKVIFNEEMIELGIKIAYQVALSY